MPIWVSVALNSSTSSLLIRDSGVKMIELKQMKPFPEKAFTSDFVDFPGSVPLHLASQTAKKCRC